MKKINKKGFTLVETLIVIAIIGVLAGIIVPSVVRYLNKNKSDFNENLVTELTSVAKEYYSENKIELPRGQLEDNISKYSDVLWATELQGNNYLTSEFVDADNNSCIAQSYIFVNNDGNGNYEYQTCVICDNGYISDTTNCNFNNSNTDNNLKCEDVNVKVTNAVYTNNKNYLASTPYEITIEGDSDVVGGIRLDNVSYVSYSNKLTYSKFDNNIATLSFKLYGTNPSNYIQCSNNINTEIDKTSPTIDLKSNHTDTDYSRSDELICDINDTGSGIKEYVIRKKGTSDSFTQVSTYLTNQTYAKTVSENGTYECVARDNVDNEASKEITVNNIINAPTTPVITASDNIASNKWHKENFDLTFTSTLDPTKSVGSIVYKYSIDGGSNWITSPTASVVTETTGTTYTVKACNSIDETLCSSTASYIAKLDKTAPILTFNISGSTATAKCSDDESGVVQENFSQSLTGTSDYTYKVTCQNNAGIETTDKHVYDYDSCKTGSNTCSGADVAYNCSSCYYGSNTCSGGYVYGSWYYSTYSGTARAISEGTSWCKTYYPDNTTYYKVYKTEKTTYYYYCYWYVYKRDSSYSSCASGSNTCKYGCSYYWDSCYSGSNTCKGGFEY